MEQPLINNEHASLKLHQKSWVTWLTLFLIPPIGILLLWKNKRHRTATSIILSAIFAFYFVFISASFIIFHINETTIYKHDIAGPIGVLKKSAPKSDINISEYFPKENVTKVFFDCNPEGKVSFVTKEKIQLSDLPSKLEYGKKKDGQLQRHTMLPK